MSAIYVESSAVLTWLLGQARAGEVRNAIETAEAVVTSTLTLAESGRALLHAVIGDELMAREASTLRGLLQRAQRGWMKMTISGRILARAGERFPVEPLRTLEAIHLATALAFAEAIPDLRLLTCDRRMQENATALGLI